MESRRENFPLKSDSIELKHKDDLFGMQFNFISWTLKLQFMFLRFFWMKWVCSYMQQFVHFRTLHQLQDNETWNEQQKAIKMIIFIFIHLMINLWIWISTSVSTVVHPSFNTAAGRTAVSDMTNSSSEWHDHQHQFYCRNRSDEMS